MSGAALVSSAPQAIRTMKAMSAQGFFWDELYREESRAVIGRLLNGRMEARVGEHLKECVKQGIADRRNGSYRRHLLTEVGSVEVWVPRIRRFNPGEVVRRYAHRAGHVDRMILACFVLGLSTRKVAEALLPVLGEPVSPATVSRVARQLDQDVAAFHRRRLRDGYTALLFDGVVLRRKTGAGAIQRPVLVALGIRPDGRKEVIDFRQTPAESQAAWEALLNDLYRRGLTGTHAQIVVCDGGPGLLAALPLVYPHLPVQRCWAHKIRNVLDKCRKADHQRVKQGLHRVMHADGIADARRAARRFVQRWQTLYPKAVACLRLDLEDLLTHYRFADPAWRQATRTTNAIERPFRELRRRTRPMGVMADRTSVERILFAIFARENRNQGVSTPFPLTQNS